MRRIALLLLLVSLLAADAVQARLQGQARIDSLLAVAGSAGYKSMADTERVNVLNELSSSYQGINSEEALKNANAALELARQSGYKRGIARAYSNLGIRGWIMGNYPEALKQLFAGLKLYEEAGYKPGIGSSYIMIGLIYTDTHNYTEGLDMEMKALKIMREQGNASGEASCLSNIGVLHMKTGNYPEALKTYRESLRLSEALKERQGVAIAYQNIGGVYAAEGNDTAALSNYAAALKISEEIGAKMLTAELHNNTAAALLKLKRYREAEEHCKRSLELSREYEGLDATRNAYETLSDIYYATGEYKRSADYYRAYVAMRDSLNNKENTRKLLQQQMQYEYDKKEAQNAATLVRERNIRYATIAGAAALLVVALLAIYAYRQKQRDHRTISKEMQRSEELLLNILPYDVAMELKAKGAAEAKYYEQVTVLFTDFVGFTTAGERMNPHELVEELDTCFRAFDEIIARHSIEKIKTVGDAYLAVCGLPKPDADHALRIVCAAIELRDYMQRRREEPGSKSFEVRIGVHTGSVVAGIVGVKKFAYDIWGDTVNTTARLEQNSLPGKINISQSTYELVKDKIACTYRGEMAAKNKGMMKMYFAEQVK